MRPAASSPRACDVRGHVAEANGLHVPVLDARDRLQPSRRAVDDHARLRLDGFHDPALDRPRDERDRAVAARGRVARVVEEDDAEVGALVLGLGDEAAVHVGVAARLVDEQAADVVDVLEGVAPLVEDRASGEGVDAAGDDAERLAGRVVVDRRNAHFAR